MADRGAGGASDDPFMATSIPGLVNVSGPELAPGTRLGAWEITAPLQTGGMGAVYRARRADGLYEQHVALKLIRGLDSAQVARFERERRRLAQMDHPGIASIIDGGTADDGRPFMVMALVDGRPIDEALEAAGATRRERVACFRALCDAVAHAHERLILHQDIKPANVLVDATGQPRLIDFGIAVDLAEPGVAAARGGTARYAAPEVLRGEAVSVRSDMFALGMLLYRLSTGRQPDRAADGGLDMHAGPPADADLAAIIACATAADPQDRYPAVGLLAADLDAWQQRRPVSARGGGRLYRMGRFFARYPLASGLGALALVSLAVGLGASVKYGNDARREAERARAALAQAEYQYEKADAFLSAQTVLNDLLQAAYAGEREQTDAVTQLLMERWREAHADYASNPRDAASLAFALGRSLYLRRDFASADEVYTAWLDAGYGSPVLQDAGRHLHALTVHDSGRQAEAEPMLRAALADATGLRNTSADRFNLAFRIARTTGSDADIAMTMAIYTEYLAENPIEELDIPQRMQFHATAYQVYRLAREYASAVTSLEAIIDLCNAYPDIAPPTRPAARMHLATVNLYALGDYGRAEAVARQIVTEDVDSAGESSTTALGYQLLAEALRERGAFDEALDALDRARDLHTRFITGSDTGRLAENLIRARVLIDQQRPDAASELLAGAAERWRAAHPEPATLPADLLLMQHWVEALRTESLENLPARIARSVQPEDLKSVQTNWLYNKITDHTARPQAS
jgi:tetratricopeptide (TPR) repeat protein